MAVNPAIQKYADAVTAYVTAISADIDDIVVKIQKLNDTITQLQNTPPVLSADDQALLDSIQSQGVALQAKADAADGKTPPPPPPPPPPVTP